MLKQEPDDFDRASPLTSRHERRNAIIVIDISFGPLSQKHLDHFGGVTLENHEKGEFPGPISSIHVAASGYQTSAHVGVTAGRGIIEDRPAFGRRIETDCGISLVFTRSQLQDITVVDMAMRVNRTDVKETLIEHAVAHNQECVFTRMHLHRNASLGGCRKYEVDVVCRLLRSGVDSHPRDDDDTRPLELVLECRSTLSCPVRDEKWFTGDYERSVTAAELLAQQCGVTEPATKLKGTPIYGGWYES
ncbi:hypothetical protein DL764_001009 [Monosporascus ibericus]|uniref:Uncharacterized protein n=1 Tax=Monosporascus ibericus TaxID=155417 RepID=A0A4Q4TR79_9PEZI|nr:hypothetical protein DL764_001009 [Monosporascus ibericus]